MSEEFRHLAEDPMLGFPLTKEPAPSKEQLAPRTSQMELDFPTLVLVEGIRGQPLDANNPVLAAESPHREQGDSCEEVS